MRVERDDISNLIDLSECVGIIAGVKGVLQIYLFGSYVYGEYREQSDIDMAIIVEDGLDPFNTAFVIKKAIRDIGNRLGVIFDIIVNNKTLFDMYAGLELTIQHEIKNKGELIYSE